MGWITNSRGNDTLTIIQHPDLKTERMNDRPCIDVFNRKLLSVFRT